MRKKLLALCMTLSLTAAADNQPLEGFLYQQAEAPNRIFTDDNIRKSNNDYTLQSVRAPCRHDNAIQKILTQ